MTSSTIIDSMALVFNGKSAIDSKKTQDKFNRLFVTDLVCRHCWGVDWKRRVSELASKGNPLQVISVTDLARATIIQSTLGKPLAMADCATLALAEEKDWVIAAGCQHVLLAAKQLHLKHISFA